MHVVTLVFFHEEAGKWSRQLLLVKLTPWEYYKLKIGDLGSVTIVKL